jgi:hypothetical protein
VFAFYCGTLKIFLEWGILGVWGVWTNPPAFDKIAGFVAQPRTIPPSPPLRIPWTSIEGHDGQKNPGKSLNIVRDLVNRLRFQKDLKKHPEILDEDVSDPFVIMGLPRSE